MAVLNSRYNTVIVGAGQAGLSVSFILRKTGRDHVVIEKEDLVAAVWRSRWDSFTLITPNWMIRLPGLGYAGDDPDDFMPRDEVVELFENYVKTNRLPIAFGTQATSVERTESGYTVKTNRGMIEATNVVVATGIFQEPKIPSFSDQIPAEIAQVHSHHYRNPESLPPGAVLVVGSAQSGAQIAEELYKNGRKVFLAVGRAGRLPRRYRGRDATRWMEDLGISNRTVNELPSPKAKFSGSAHATGRDGGRALNLHQYAHDGVTLLGHIESVHGFEIHLANDLKENLEGADRREAEFVKAIDKYIEENGLDIPNEELPQFRDGFDQEEILRLDLQTAGIHSIVWATGFKFDYGFIKLPVTDEDGYPIQERGVTKYPGLYFVGMPFLHTIKSGLLAGVGDDARYIVNNIVAHG